MASSSLGESVDEEQLMPLPGAKNKFWLHFRFCVDSIVHVLDHLKTATLALLVM